MAISTALAVYFVIWWTVLFAVLPWGIRSQHEGGEVEPGTDPGAPILPNLKRKALWTTVAATVVFFAWYYVYVNRLVTLDQLNATTVKNLKGKWVTHLGSGLGTKYSFEASPVVQDGVMYLASGNDDVFALDARTGAEKWERLSGIEA